MTQKGTRKKEMDIYNQMQERKKKKETKAETATLILEKENMATCS